MANGAVFGDQGSDDWMDPERRRVAYGDWLDLVNRADVVVHVDAGGRYSLHRPGVLIVAEEDLDDSRLRDNLADLGIPTTTDTDQASRQDQIEETGLGFAHVRISRAYDVVRVADFLRSLDGRRPLRVGPEHVLATAQSGVLGPAGLPQPAAPDDAQMKLRAQLADVTPTVRVAVIDSGLVTEPRDPLLGGSHLAGPTVAVINPAPDPLWDDPGRSLVHWQGGHGTHVAGVLAEAARGTASILHYGVLSNPDLPLPLVSEAEVARCVASALKEGCRVINLSLGGPAAPEYDTLAISLVTARAAGAKRSDEDHCSDDAVLVASAGNENLPGPRYPAALKGVIGVGAIETDGGRRCDFSNYGPWVDCCALGRDIFGPHVSGRGGPVPGGPLDFDGWALWSGTSFAAPLVSGRIAARIADGVGSARVAAAMVLSAGTPVPGLNIGVWVS